MIASDASYNLNYSVSPGLEDNTITDPKERTRVFGQYDHLRIYGLDYPDLLREAGFIIAEENYYDTISADIVKLYNLNMKEFMFAPGKPG